MSRRVMYECDRCGATDKPPNRGDFDWGQIEVSGAARPSSTKAQWDLCPPCCRVLRGMLTPPDRAPEHVKMEKLEDRPR